MSSPPDYERMGQVMTDRGWVAWLNPNHLWAVGIEKNGGLEVLGMGKTMVAAFDMAERSTEGKDASN